MHQNEIYFNNILMNILIIILMNKNLNIKNKAYVMGIGDWGLGQIPNLQSTIPNPQIQILIKLVKKKINFINLFLK